MLHAKTTTMTYRPAAAAAVWRKADFICLPSAAAVKAVMCHRGVAPVMGMEDARVD